MLRRLKWIYLLPVFVLLFLGAGFGMYYAVITPQMEKTKTAQKGWTQARTDCQAAESGYQGHLDAQVKNSRDLLDNYYTFHAIQNRMPNIYNMKVKYANDTHGGLIEWYRIMGTGAMIRELNRWTKGYHLAKLPKFEFKGTLPFEEGLPDVKMVGVDFDKQTFTARGLQDLVDQVSRRSGYSYFPLIVTPDGGKVTIKVHRTDRRHRPTKPLLTMDYTCKGYFMTRAWDPNSYADANAPDILNAKKLIAEPPKMVAKRTEFLPAPEGNGPPPKLLFFLEPQGVEP